MAKCGLGFVSGFGFMCQFVAPRHLWLAFRGFEAWGDRLLEPPTLESVYVDHFRLELSVRKNRRKLDSFLKWGFLWLVGRCPGDESLAGGDSVDSADSLNGILHELILTEAVERGDNVELSRNQVSLDEVRERL